jgi:hypothetical protein
MSEKAKEGGSSDSGRSKEPQKAHKTAKNKGGRPQNPIWAHYVEGDARNDNSNRKDATCKYCKFVLKGARVEKMRAHTLECPNTAPEAKLLLEEELGKDMPAPVAPTAGRAVLKAAKGQQLVTNSFRSEKPFTDEENFTHNVALLRWFVTSSIPFNALSNPFFLAYIGMVSSNRSSPAGENLTDSNCMQCAALSN